MHERERRRFGWERWASVFVAGALAACGASQPAPSEPPLLGSTPSPSGPPPVPPSPVASGSAPVVPTTASPAESAPVASRPVSVEATSERRAAAAINAFGFDVLHALVASKPDDNQFYSPASLSTALTMVYLGARANTAAEMAHALRFEHVSGQADHAEGADVAEAFQALQRTLATRNTARVKLRVANSAWVSPTAKLLAPYTDGVKRAFGAPPRIVDFAQPARASATINAWASQVTDRMIPHAIDANALSASTRLCLVNAVFFDGKWLEPFEPEQTRAEPFHLLGGSSVDVPLMNQSVDAPYAENDDWQAVDLPYQGGKLSMLVILPRPNKLPTVEASLTSSTLDAMVAALRKNAVALSLPKLELSTSYLMNPTLESLGMRAAFSSSADFGDMSQESLAIDQVQHTAVVDVDEKGTRAAAVTAVVMAPISLVIRIPMKVDRPYFFAIRDVETGVVLFIGKVVDPRPH